MKSIFVLLFICFAVIKVDAQGYGLDNTDPAVFTKYRIPQTDLKSLWFNTGLNFGSNKTINSYDQSFFYFSNNSYNSNFNYTFNPQYLLLHESEDNFFNFQIDVDGNYAHSYSSNESSQINTSNQSKQNDYSIVINLSSTYRRYFNSGNIFYSLSPHINAYMNQSKTEVISGTSAGNYINRKTQEYSISLGTGIGKLRDVTPVVVAVRFQERMKQLGLINQNLNENTIEDLAMQFYKRVYYNDIYSRPDKYFWQGIDKVLDKDGISIQGLNMYADAYLREAMSEVRFFRQEGLITGINLQLRYYNYYEYPTVLNENLNLLANPYLMYSHQLSLNSQLSFNLILSGGPVLTKPSYIKQNYTINAILGYDYELTDRLVCSVTNHLMYYINNESTQYRTINEYLSLYLDYFVEDNLLLNASYGWYYTYNKNSFFKSEQLVNSLNIGFTYYFDRGFIMN